MNFLLIFFIVATLAVLVVGLVVMVKGGKVNKEYSNKLMQARIALQAISIVIVLLIILTRY